MRTPPWTGNDTAPAYRRARRWIRPDLAAVPCGARTRAGTPCRAPAARGRRRCRMHGGAPGAGAPRGKGNALKHGWWSAAARAERQHAAALIEEAERALEEVAEGTG